MPIAWKFLLLFLLAATPCGEILGRAIAATPDSKSGTRNRGHWPDRAGAV